MKRTIATLTVILCLAVFVIPKVHAGEVDILVNKLVEKGILTPLESQIILDETKAEVAKQNAQGKNSAIPAWIQTLKLKGDFRLRYQYERREQDTEGRERGRIRYRLGIISNPVDQIEIGAGLASGGSSARSTNQTLGGENGAFGTGDIRLDYAYAKYTPMNGLSMIGGKFKRKAWLWAPTDLLWDGDINPEGGSVHYEKSINGETDLFTNSGVWIMRHKDQVDMVDPFLAYFQGGIKYKGEKFDAKIAGTYYNFDGVKGDSQLDTNSSADTNTYVGGVYKYDYDSGAIGAEVGAKKLFGGLPLDIDGRIALFGEYVNNPDPEKENTGWILGLKFGHSKVKKPKSWQCKYMYARLGKDAWLDALPDSDRYDPGRTDVKSHEVVFKYALKKHLTFGLDYYNNDRIKSAKNREHVIQADLVFKF